ncbi:T9SS-dependent M36 family metallopeptidase [Mesonia aquimarina]|uniref:T9SS-dependent M36 family metallopeptidase n=1 Tax=Mesonia aquimarina TaxID=1504967 RepID=UPI000EF568E8|nr:T9SS-dependent M36 family metallopeptidase [Mesonia aquimarina]
MYKTTFLFLLALFVSFSFQAQEQVEQLCKDYLLKNQQSFLESDVQDLKIISEHYSQNKAYNYVYVQQFLDENPIQNAMGTFVIKNGEVVSYQGNFIRNIDAKKNISQPKISPIEALKKATENVKINYEGEVRLIESENKLLVKAPEISDQAIPVDLIYIAEEEKLSLSWKLVIKKNNHWWSIAVDANSGKILWKNDWVNECSFDSFENDKKSVLEKKLAKNAIVFSTNASYNVYERPIASPDHGSRTLVNSPENLNASPFGWHDDNGVDGEEYTDTRGNNVWAYENRDGDNNVGRFAEGGTNLVFDQNLNLNQDPLAYVDAATVNLFYWNNLMHDVWHEYGFDEASGNFQTTNYGSVGFGSDQVLARAQDGANNGPGNNATFGTPPDGQSGVMRMFTWGSTDPPFLLSINSPQSLAGNYEALQAVFAANIPISGIQSDLVLIEESNSFTSDPYDACETIANANQLNGNIAVIRRGTCSFLEKIQKVQNAGAVGAIIVNNVGGDVIYMQSNSTPNITIPAIMISQSDGTPLINSLIANQTINGTLENIGPFGKDGDFDAGIIAHEYGHGISNRLTGGAASADCLVGCVDYDQNGNCIQATEQMGEGWSDYFALVMTQKTTDQAEDAKGIATYVTNQPIDGTGIRNAPYSTDFSVNDFTYGDTNNTSQLSAPHGVGFVWATMLWDLHWAFIGEYGFDDDIYNGTGGNNKVMQLVIDGLKLQTCNPGFVDGRDAILQADILQNNGDNQCLIWSVFANRGLGYSATQGSSLSRTDQTEAFDMPPNAVLDCSLGIGATEENLWRVYPNPTNGLVTISTKNSVNNSAEINIFDINGREVFTATTTASQPVDVSSLTTGVYILKIQSGEKIQTEKLIVE